MQNFKIFSGNAHREFSEKVAKSLDVELSNAEITRFSDGEINIRLCESVRGKEVCVMNEICPWDISYSSLTYELCNDILILRRDFRKLKQLV